jgi:hypothetical protein
MDKQTTMRSFNSHFSDFMKDILLIFPTNNEIKNGLKTFELIKNMNPSMVIKVWYANIYIPYNKIISEGDLNFFFEKNYSSDLNNVSNINDILNIIDKIRGPVKNMDSINQKHTMKYIQNLSELSRLYSTK